MKEKIKKNYEKFKKLYSNRRYRALMILGFYIIFFVVFYIIITSNQIVTVNELDNKELSVLDKFEIMDNYEYSYIIKQKYNDKDIINYNISGKTYNAKQAFNIENDFNGYYIENNTLYIIRDDIKEKALKSPLELDLLKIQLNDIVKFIESAQLVSTTNNYSNETIKNNYILPVKDFIKLYYNEDIIDEEEEFVEINTYEKNKQIIKVEMDLTNADKYENYPVKFHNIELNYTNINGVNKLE